MELLLNLGIQGKLLIAQIINFIILLWVLKKFVYIPLLKVMEERRRKIKKGIADAEKSSQKLEEMRAEEERIIKKAQQEAQAIIAKAEKQAQKNSEEIIQQTKLKAKEVIEEAKKEIKNEKNKALEEAKDQIAELAFLMAEKVIDKKMNQNNDHDIIKKEIKD